MIFIIHIENLLFARHYWTDLNVKMAHKVGTIISIFTLEEFN